MATVLNAATELHQRLSAFFQTSAFNLTPVEGGASSRSYYKIEFTEKSYFPEDTIIVMVAPREDVRMLVEYAHIDYYLRRMKVNTPRLYEINRLEGWIFLEYVTAPTLEMYLKANPGTMESTMTALIDFLFSIQQKCKWEKQTPAFQRRFDYEKYMFEFNFHVKEQLLTFYFKQDFNFKTLSKLAHEICSVLNISNPLFVHRDFQSSNIFADASTTTPPTFSIIDFQDARHGTPVYDLVSCLWDSYIDVPASLQKALVDRYYDYLKEQKIDWSRDYYQQMIDYSIIQRKLHDAGAFAYNYRRFNDKKYLRFIPRTMEMVVSTMEKYTYFDEARALFSEIK